MQANQSAVKYTPMNEITSDSQIEYVHAKESELVKKFGNILIVNASFHLLCTFLGKNLGYFLSKKPFFYGTIPEWAGKTVEQVVKTRNIIQDRILDLLYEKDSGSFKALRCQIRSSADGKPFVYSSWFSATNKVPEEIARTNTMNLEQARIIQLVDQMCYRIDYLISKIDEYKNCDYDFIVLEEFQRISKFFKIVAEQSKSAIAELFRYQALSNDDKKKPNSMKKLNGPPKAPTKAVNVTKTLTLAPKKKSKSKKAKIVKPVESVEQVEQVESIKSMQTDEPVAIGSLPNKPVTKEISYASMAGSTVVNDELFQINEDTMDTQDFEEPQFNTDNCQEEEVIEEFPVLSAQPLASKKHSKAAKPAKPILNIVRPTKSRQAKPAPVKTVAVKSVPAKTVSAPVKAVTKSVSPIIKKDQISVKSTVDDMIKVDIFTGMVNGQSTFKATLMPRSVYESDSISLSMTKVDMYDGIVDGKVAFRKILVPSALYESFNSV